MAFEYRKPKLYEVFADFGKRNGLAPKWVPVHSGNDFEEARMVANFWDERVNIRFVDRTRWTWQDWMNHKWDALEEYIRTGRNR